MSEDLLYKVNDDNLKPIQDKAEEVQDNIENALFICEQEEIAEDDRKEFLRLLEEAEHEIEQLKKMVLESMEELEDEEEEDED